MKKWCKYILMSVMAMGLLAACSEDDDAYSYGDFLYELVTYEGSEEGKAVFTYQSYNDSPLVTLTASNVKSVDAPKGQRMLLNYVIEQSLAANDQVVTVKGLAKVNTDTIAVVESSKLDTTKMDPVKVASVWRTGNYLNVRCKVLYTETPRMMALATTGEVGEDGALQCYQLQDLMGAQPYYWTETYFSYYIEPAISNADCKTLIYNVNDEKGAMKFDFKIRD